MDSVIISSMNCQGLGDMRKRRDVFQYLKQKKYSIYCLQDTHFDKKIEQYVRSEWGYECFFASYSSNSRGVAVMFNNNFEFKVKDVKRDDNGNFIVISFSVMEEEFVLVNVYGPNRDSPKFYDDLFDIVKSYNNIYVIAVGDWNLVLEPDKDYDNYLHINNPKAKEALQRMMDGIPLADIWRECNPECKRFTWRKSNPLKQSRLDFFLMSDYLFGWFEEADIVPGYRSDHSMVTLTLKGEAITSYWRLGHQDI